MNISNTNTYTNLVLCLLCLLLAASASFNTSAQTPDDDTPIVFDTLPTSWGAISVAADVMVTMRDGIAIAVDIYHPLTDDTFPTLYAAGPFPHSSSILEDSTSQTGPLAWYISQGYAVVVANVRGTGMSEGEYSFFALEEQQDHYEIIEWIAEQPWSNGQVAGTGAGYYGTSQWHMAIQGPPSLECIAPVSAVLDPYREWVKPGGVNNNDFITGWYDREIRLANAYSSNSPRLVSYDLRLAQLEHPFYDDYWQIRSGQDSVSLINAPVFALHEWNLDKNTADLSSTMDALNRLNVINKILIKNQDDPVPFIHDVPFLAEELMPFYDWCLNGRRPTSPFIEKPRIRFQVNGQNSIKVEQNWPPGNVIHEARFLNNPVGNNQPAGSLGTEQSIDNQAMTAFNTGNGDDMISFVTPPLENNVEIDGPSMLELYISSTASDRAYEVSVFSEEVSIAEPESSRLPGFLAPPVEITESTITIGARTLITRGSLKASARIKDAVKSSTFKPFYTLTEEASVIPGQVYRLDIALRQIAHRISAGNRLVVEVRAINDGSITEGPGTDMIHHSQSYPSRLWLPVVQSVQVLNELRAAETAARNQAAEDEEAEAFFDEEFGDAENSEDNTGFFVPL